jgi:MoaA/NifB/PqqE/SkfB family radical SAM enzyme
MKTWYRFLVALVTLDAIAARVNAVEAALPYNKIAPWTLEIYPTLRCNLDCAFCDTTERHRPPVAELPLPRWLELLEEAAAAGAKALMILGGGEPLIASATLPLMLRAKALGLHGFLTTNGTFLNRETRAQLVKCGWDELHVSVDGARPETHDALRGRPNAFKKTVSNLCALRLERGKNLLPRLGLHTVLTRSNWREIPEILQLGAALGVARIDFDGLIAYRPEQKALLIPPEEQPALKALIQDSLPLAHSLGIETSLNTALGDPRGNTRPPASPRPALAGAPCLKPWHHLTIQADGRISPCCVLAGEGGSLKSGSLLKSWAEDSFLQAIRAELRSHQPRARCAECSPNILAQEQAIRERL